MRLSFVADILIDAEDRLGELLSNQVPLREPGGTFGNTLPVGINKKQSHYFQKMANNKDVV